MLANGDLEGRLAYSEIASVRFSILIFTDVLDVILVAMNKGVAVFARSGQASIFHRVKTIFVIPALWFGIVVLGQEVYVSIVILSRGHWVRPRPSMKTKNRGLRTMTISSNKGSCQGQKEMK